MAKFEILIATNGLKLYQIRLLLRLLDVSQKLSDDAVHPFQRRRIVLLKFTPNEEKIIRIT